MKKAINVIAAMMSLIVAAAETNSYVLDNRTGTRQFTAGVAETIVYDPAWVGEESCTISYGDSTIVSAATSAGTYKWYPCSEQGTLTYTAGSTTMTVNYKVIEQDVTLTITLVPGKPVPVALPFGNAKVEWMSVLKKDNLVAGTKVKVPMGSGGYSCYELVTSENGLEWSLQNGETSATSVATGDAIWITIPNKAENKEITLVGKMSLTEPDVEIAKGINLICFPTIEDVLLNDKTLEWKDGESPAKLDRIEMIDAKTGEFKFYLFDGERWTDTTVAASKDKDETKVIKAGQGFIYEHYGETIHLPKTRTTTK